MLNVYYSARQINLSETETAWRLESELGEAEAGSAEGERIVHGYGQRQGREVVVADSALARELKVGDLVDVDDDGVIVTRTGDVRGLGNHSTPSNS